MPARPRLRRILVPLDGSEASEEVLPIVACLAGPFDFEILLLHVVEATRSLPGSPTGAKSGRDPETEAAYLAQVAAPLEDRGLRVAKTVRAGLPRQRHPRRRRRDEEWPGRDVDPWSDGLGRLFLGERRPARAESGVGAGPLVEAAGGPREPGPRP